MLPAQSQLNFLFSSLLICLQLCINIVVLFIPPMAFTVNLFIVMDLVE